MADEKALAAQGGGAQVPAYMQKFMQTSKQDTAAMATASISVPRLSFRGKKFRWKKDGEEEVVKGDTVKVVILGVEPGPGKSIKTYYAKKYEPGSTDPPDCSSSNGVTPDAWVASPQCSNCAKCPMNAFGSATSMKGKPAKACKDGKRLWVARPEVDKDGNCTTVDPNDYYGLSVPVMSLRDMSEYGKYVQRNGFPLGFLVTELGFEDDSEFPQLTFAHKGFVPEEATEPIAQISEQRPWLVDYDVPLLPDGGEGGGRDIPQPSSQAAKPQVPNGGGDGKTIEDVVGAW